MYRLKPPFAAPILLLTVSLAFAQEAAPGRSTRDFLGLGAKPDEAAAKRGEKLYAPNCAFCHGEKARGAEGPNLVRSTVVLHDENGELIGPVIAKGVVANGMPAFPNFTPDQLKDLAQFLRMQVELVANRGLYQRLKVVTGDAKKGEAVFGQRCASCHSPTGDLSKIGSKYPPDQVQNRFLFPPRARQPRDVVVTTAAGGERLAEGKLKQIDDFEVSLVDRSGAYRSFERNRVRVRLSDPLAAHRTLLETLTDDTMHDLTAYLVTLK